MYSLQASIQPVVIYSVIVVEDSVVVVALLGPLLVISPRRDWEGNEHANKHGCHAGPTEKETNQHPDSLEPQSKENVNCNISTAMATRYAIGRCCLYGVHTVEKQKSDLCRSEGDGSRAWTTRPFGHPAARKRPTGCS